MTNRQAEREAAMPLRCEVVDGAIRIVLGMKTLRVAAENHPVFWDGESDASQPNLNITDEVVFLNEVCRKINDEDEIGGTLLTRMLDDAIEQAVSDGCEGVDHES